MSKKVLIVDDDKDLVQSLVQAFKVNGYDVAVAYSGSEGLAKLKEEKPDIIVLDVMMETDTAGFEVANQIRSTRDTSQFKEFSQVPIIMLTAINQVTNSRFSLNENESFLRGINEFLTKPVDIGELIEKVNQCVN